MSRTDDSEARIDAILRDLQRTAEQAELTRERLDAYLAARPRPEDPR